MRTKEEIFGDFEPEEFLTRCSLDFKFWCENVIQMDEDHSKCLTLKPFHEEWVELINKNDRLALIAPRGHGKTEVLGIALPLWNCFFRMSFFYMVISKTEKQSVRVLERIKNKIEDNELLSELKPNTTDTWTKTEMNLSNRSKIYCKPYNSQIKGEHTDFAFCDEVSEYTDHEIFWDVILPTVVKKNGKLIAVGTPKSESDLLATLRDKGMFKSKTYRAIENKKPIWEEEFPMEKLNKLKKIDPHSFKRQYLCKTVGSRESFFSMDDIVACSDKSYSFTKETGDKIYAGVDFAMAKGKHADYTVAVILEKLRDGTLIIRDMERMKGAHMKTQIIRLKQIFDLTNPRTILLDESTFGQAFLQEFKADGYPVRGQNFQAQNRLRLLFNLQKAINRNKLLIPRHPDHSKTRTLTNILISELQGFELGETASGRKTLKSTSSHDDTAMALALAVKSATEQKGFVTYVGKRK